MSREASPGGWQPLGAVPPRHLADAWRQLHWAAQVPAAFAAALVEARSDDSHLNLGWDAREEALTTHPAADLRAGLRLADQTLVLLGAGGGVREYPLADRTLLDALGWMRASAEAAGAPLRAALEPPGWDMPEHAVAAGRRFGGAPTAALVEVARWYGNAALALAELAAATPGASVPRCWPHHFDLATLVALEPDAPAEEAPAIGVGLAPADASVDEPYVYVNPWPPPAASPLPTLEGGGEWYRDDFFGALLRASRLLEAGPGGQRGRLELFLRSAVAAARRLLGRED